LAASPFFFFMLLLLPPPHLLYLLLVPAAFVSTWDSTATHRTPAAESASQSPPRLLRTVAERAAAPPFRA
jgi:hypothetical protein